MPIYVNKKDRESNAALLRRFVRRVQQSKILSKAKESRFFKKSKSKRQQKASALRREQIRHERGRLIKLGLLEERQLIPKEDLKKILKKE